MACSTGSLDKTQDEIQSPVPLKTPITWTEQMNVMLCREVDYINPFKYKERTKERGKCWEEVAVNLRKHGYDVTKRSVRDKFKALRDQIVKRNNKEERESGIAPEHSDADKELTQIIEDLVEIQKETDLEARDQQQEEEKKKLDGVEMRKRALESFSETDKRLKSDKEDKPRRKRNTGSDASQFLLKKLDMDREIKEREFELKREEAQKRQQYEERRLDREEREEERRRQDEERRREREAIEEERRRRDGEMRREREEREEAIRRQDEAERQRRMDLFQQQLMQQNQMIMMMLKKHDQ